MIIGMSAALTSVRIVPACWARSISTWVVARSTVRVGSTADRSVARAHQRVLSRRVGGSDLRTLAHDVGEHLEGFAVRPLDAGLGHREDVLELALDHRHHQRVLGREVAIERADTQAGARGDVIHLGLDALLGERLGGSGEDARPVAGLVGALGSIPAGIHRGV